MKKKKKKKKRTTSDLLHKVTVHHELILVDLHFPSIATFRVAFVNLTALLAAENLLKEILSTFLCECNRFLV